MFEKMRPLYDKVLIELAEREEKTAGGIFIPDSAQEKTQKGKVIAAGQGRISSEGTLTKLSVKPGDMVFFGKYSGTQAGEKHVILREDEILAVMED